jgi:hypothetical protein
MEGIKMMKEMATFLLERKDVFLTEEGKRILKELLSKNDWQGSEK